MRHVGTAFFHGDPVRVFIANMSNNYITGLNLIHQLLRVDPHMLMSWHSDLLKRELHHGQFVKFDPYFDNIFDMPDKEFDDVTYLLCGDGAEGVWLNACKVTTAVLSKVHRYINVHSRPPKIKTIKEYLKFTKDLNYDDIYNTRQRCVGYHKAHVASVVPRASHDEFFSGLSESSGILKINTSI